MSCGDFDCDNPPSGITFEDNPYGESLLGIEIATDPSDSYKIYETRFIFSADPLSYCTEIVAVQPVQDVYTSFSGGQAQFT